MFGQRQRLKKRRDASHGVDGRANVVFEPGQRQLLGARTAADGFVRFEYEDVDSGAGKRDRSSEAVRPRPYDNRI